MNRSSQKRGTPGSDSGLDGKKWQPVDGDRSRRLRNRTEKTALVYHSKNLQFDRIDFRETFTVVHEHVKQYCLALHIRVPAFIRIYHRSWRQFTEEERHYASADRASVRPLCFTFSREPIVRSPSPSSDRRKTSRHRQQSLKHREERLNAPVQLLVPLLYGFVNVWKREEIKRWSDDRRRVWKSRRECPLEYYYLFKDPNQKQRKGEWNAEEQKLFRQRVAFFAQNQLRLFGRLQWGYFSLTIPTRTGAQCAARYKSLVHSELIHDEDFGYNDMGVFCQVGVPKLYEISQELNVLSDYWKTEAAKRAEEEIEKHIHAPEDKVVSTSTSSASLHSTERFDWGKVCLWNTKRRAKELPPLAPQQSSQTSPPAILLPPPPPPPAPISQPLLQASPVVTSPSILLPPPPPSFSPPAARLLAKSPVAPPDEAAELVLSNAAMDGVAWQINEQSRRNKRYQHRKNGTRFYEPPLASTRALLDTDSSDHSGSEAEEAPRRSFSRAVPRYEEGAAPRRVVKKIKKKSAFAEDDFDDLIDDSHENELGFVVRDGITGQEVNYEHMANGDDDYSQVELLEEDTQQRLPAPKMQTVPSTISTTSAAASSHSVEIFNQPEEEEEVQEVPRRENSPPLGEVPENLREYLDGSYWAMQPIRPEEVDLAEEDYDAPASRRPVLVLQKKVNALEEIKKKRLLGVAKPREKPETRIDLAGAEEEEQTNGGTSEKEEEEEEEDERPTASPADYIEAEEQKPHLQGAGPFSATYAFSSDTSMSTPNKRARSAFDVIAYSSSRATPRPASSPAFSSASFYERPVFSSPPLPKRTKTAPNITRHSAPSSTASVPAQRTSAPHVPSSPLSASSQRVPASSNAQPSASSVTAQRVSPSNSARQPSVAPYLSSPRPSASSAVPKMNASASFASQRSLTVSAAPSYPKNLRDRKGPSFKRTFQSNTSENVPPSSDLPPSSLRPPATSSIVMSVSTSPRVSGSERFPYDCQTDFSNFIGIPFQQFLSLNAIPPSSSLFPPEPDVEVLSDRLSKCFDAVRQRDNTGGRPPAEYEESISLLRTLTFHIRTSPAGSMSTSEFIGALVRSVKRFVKQRPLRDAGNERGWLVKLSCSLRFYVLDWVSRIFSERANQNTPTDEEKLFSRLSKLAHYIFCDVVQLMTVINLPLRDELPRHPLFSLWRKLMFVCDERMVFAGIDFSGKLGEVVQLIAPTPMTTIACAEDWGEFCWKLVFMSACLYRYDDQGVFREVSSVPANWVLVLLLLRQSPLSPKTYQPTPCFWEQLEHSQRSAPGGLQPTLETMSLVKPMEKYLITLLQRLQALSMLWYAEQTGELLNLLWSFVSSRRFHSEGKRWPRWISSLSGVGSYVPNASFGSVTSYFDGVLRVMYQQWKKLESGDRLLMTMKKFTGSVYSSISKYTVLSEAPTVAEGQLSISSLSNLFAMLLLVSRFYYKRSAQDQISFPDDVAQRIIGLVDFAKCCTEAKVLTLLALLQSCRIQATDFTLLLKKPLSAGSDPRIQSLSALITTLVTEYVSLVREQEHSVPSSTSIASAPAPKAPAVSKQKAAPVPPAFPPPAVLPAIFASATSVLLQRHLEEVGGAIQLLIADRRDDLSGSQLILSSLLPLLDTRVCGGPRAPLLALIKHIAAHFSGYQKRNARDASDLLQLIKATVESKLKGADPLAPDIVEMQNVMLEVIVCLHEHGYIRQQDLPGAFSFAKQMEKALRMQKDRSRTHVRTLPLRLWSRLLSNALHAKELLSPESSTQSLQIACSALFEDPQLCWPLATRLFSALRTYVDEAVHTKTARGLYRDLNVPLLQTLFGGNALVSAPLRSEADCFHLLSELLGRVSAVTDEASLKTIRSVFQFMGIVIAQRLEECPDREPLPAASADGITFPSNDQKSYSIRAHQFMAMCFSRCPLVLFELKENPFSLFQFFSKKLIQTDKPSEHVLARLGPLLGGLAQLNYREENSVFLPIVKLVAHCTSTPTNPDWLLERLAKAFTVPDDCPPHIRVAVHNLRMYLLGDVFRQAFSPTATPSPFKGACKLFRRLIRETHRLRAECPGVAQLLLPAARSLLQRLRNIQPFTTVTRCSDTCELYSTLSCLLEAAARLPSSSPLEGQQGLVFRAVFQQLCLDVTSLCNTNTGPAEVQVDLGEWVAVEAHRADELFRELPTQTPIPIGYQTMIAENIIHKWAPRHGHDVNLQRHQLRVESSAYSLLQHASRLVARGSCGDLLVSECLVSLRRWWSIMSQSEYLLDQNSDRLRVYRLALASVGLIGAADALSWMKTDTKPAPKDHPLNALFDPL